MNVIFLQPVLQDKIWGGQKLGQVFDLDLPSETVGEAWVISGHPHGISKISQPESLAGQGLDDFYANHPDFFGGQNDQKFPLLVKILDAKDDLSVQVHPDDAYAQGHEGPGELGKTECWYIIDAEPGAELILGHHAGSRQEFEAMIEAGQWDQLLRKVPVKPGDFFYVPHGTIHAIGAGIMILETQQSSDTTYRVYDYNRRDKEGKLRDLHLDQAADVTLFPHQDASLDLLVEKLEGAEITTFLDNDYFLVEKWAINGQADLDVSEDYQLGTVIEGQGQLVIGDQVYPLVKGQSFILAYDLEEIKLEGQMTLIVSSPGA